MLETKIDCPWTEFKDVLKDWDKVMEKSEEISKEIGQQLFFINPECKEVFPTLANVDEKDLVFHEDFLTHSRAILRGLNMAVQNLSAKYEEDNEILPVISETHIKRGVTCSMMQELKTAVIRSCFDILHLSNHNKKSWEIALNFIFLNYVCAAYPENEKTFIFDVPEEDYF